MEFDFAVATGRTSDPERMLFVLTAAESTCGAMFSTAIRSKDSKDSTSHKTQAFLNCLTSFGFLLVCAEVRQRSECD